MNLPNILIIDDDIAVRESLSEVLEDDYNITCVKSGFEAVKEIYRHDFDLVLLDVMMPEMDGIETLELIKDYDKNINVIMISAVDRAQEAITSVKLGAYDYITKPFEPEEILNLSGRIIEKTNHSTNKKNSQPLKSSAFSNGSAQDQAFVEARNSFERRYLLRMLEKYEWNQSLTAKRIGIHRNTLIKKMRVLNLKSVPDSEV